MLLCCSGSVDSTLNQIERLLDAAKGWQSVLNWRFKTLLEVFLSFGSQQPFNLALWREIRSLPEL